MRVGVLARLLFAAVLSAIGVLNLFYGDFALQWQPVPDFVAHRHELALASGGFLVLCGVALALKKNAALAATLTVLYLIFWVALLQGPVALAHPASIASWLGFFENLAVLAAAIIVLASVSGEPNSVYVLARVLFGVSCLVFGLSHFVYTDVTTGMIPAWMPDRTLLAGLTGAGHCAAGVAILSGRLSRLGATLEALMMTSFVALVHVTGVLHAPADRLQWTMLVFAFALAGSAWVIAASLAGRPWLKSRAA